MQEFLVPRGFFVVTGEAHDGSSALNAFDMALKEAGVTHCNLVEVSSILPLDCKEMEPQDIIPVGAITFCVMAKMSGTYGERIGCGLAWAWGTDHEGDRIGIVAEHHGNFGEAEVEKMLRIKVERMAEVREMKLEAVKTKVSSIICEGNYGCVVSILVYLP